MIALQMYRSMSRYVAARAVGSRMPGLLAGPLTPLRLATIDEPKLIGPGWGRLAPRLSGICGSDLSALSGQTSFYFSSLVSMPFVPGHEVVGELYDDLEDLPAGTRVVLSPVLSCAARGVERCAPCQAGAVGRCERVTVGHVAPGLQTGYCADTGGGWGAMLVAHRSQVFPVPDRLPDDRAVLVEPLACAIHAALKAEPEPGASVLVVGAGTVGLLTLLALRALTSGRADPGRGEARRPARPRPAARGDRRDPPGRRRVGHPPGHPRAPPDPRTRTAVPARGRGRGHRLRGVRVLARPRGAHHPGGRAGRPGGDAGERRGPLARLVPGAGGDRGVRCRHRAAPRRSPRGVRPGHRPGR